MEVEDESQRCRNSASIFSRNSCKIKTVVCGSGFPEVFVVVGSKGKCAVNTEILEKRILIKISKRAICIE